MALDGVFLSGIVSELEDKIVLGRVDKIYQPEKDEIHMQVRSQAGSLKLLLSASSSHARVHLTKVNKPNPQAPPLFCMVLRKHLTGSKILSISQPGLERIVNITFRSLNEMGDEEEKNLIIEIMGRHSNIILTDNENRIIDSIKHVNESISRVRQVLPGLEYISPPSQDKINPIGINKDQLLSLLSEAVNPLDLPKILTKKFTGISKTTAEEIVFSAIGNPTGNEDLDSNNIDQVVQSFTSFFNKIKSKEYSPCVLMDNKKARDILPFHYSMFPYDNHSLYSTFGDALDNFYKDRDQEERTKQRTANLVKLAKTNLDRCRKKLVLQEKEIDKSEKADSYRHFGDLLTANLYAVPKGAEEVTLIDYYDPNGSSVTIPLDPTKTPAQNAQGYYKKYNKAKTALTEHKRMLENTKLEIEYLESILESLSNAFAEQDIIEIREELMQEGYIKKKASRANNAKNRSKSKPHHYISSDDYDIFVGKNNLQNDLLTLKKASNNDIWLHTKDIPGSHVIIKSKGTEIPENTLLEAANLAAYYSKGKQSGNVPVDYCPKKNVRKPNGAKPGMVIYEHYNTIYITPSEELINRLKKVE